LKAKQKCYVIEAKLLERVVSVQLLDHLTTEGLLLRHQSAYRKFHSTKTALLKV